MRWESDVLVMHMQSKHHTYWFDVGAASQTVGHY